MRREQSTTRPVRTTTTRHRTLRRFRRLRFLTPLVVVLWGLGFWTAVAQGPADAPGPLPAAPDGVPFAVGESPSAEVVTQPETPAPVVTLPEPGIAEVALSRRPARAGNSVFTLTGKNAGAEGAPIQVETLSQDTVKRINGQVLAFAVRAPQAGAAPALDLSIDYSGFEFAYGGDWIGRVRVYRLPECALTTPEKEECLTRELVPSVLDAEARTISLDLSDSPGRPANPGSRDQAGGGSVYTLTAGVSGPSGNFAASDISSSGSWSVGLQTGDFNYSYSIDVPPAWAGPTPEVSLAYSSASVDGRTSATNNQASHIGMGWGLPVMASISRAYAVCEDDGYASDPRWAAPAQPYTDLCWAGDHLFITLNGTSSRLISSGPNSFRPENNPNWRVERQTYAANGDNNGESFLVYTPDGMTYRFGYEEYSAQVAPVFGNQAGEPCWGGTYPARCDQAVTWYLDRAWDMTGHRLDLVYIDTENRYAVRGHGTGEPAGQVTDPNNPYGYYERDVFLLFISYGYDWAVGDYVNVQFEQIWRTDYPADLDCWATSTSCTGVAPSFWSTQAISKITTKGFQNRTVKEYYLTYSYVNGALWLRHVQERGYNSLTGASVYLPALRFDSSSLNNRWNAVGGSSLPMPRISKIRDELGSDVSVTYGTPFPCSASTLPSTVAFYDNTRSCFPQYEVGGVYGGFNAFVKYAVTRVTVADSTTSGSPTVVTDYAYSGGGAWRYDQSPVIPAAKKSWNQWRGYGAVTVTKGSGTISKTKYEFFRGMEGDYYPPTGTRSTVWVGTTAIACFTSSYHDIDQLRGHLFSEKSLDQANAEVSNPRIINTL